MRLNFIERPAMDDSGRCLMSEIPIRFAIKGRGSVVDARACYHCKEQMQTLGHLVNADADRGDLLRPHTQGEMPEVFE